MTTSIIDPNRTTRKGHTCEFSESSDSLDILCRYSLDILNIRAHETIFRGDLMKPNARRQKEMFVSTMTELLWKVKTFSIKKQKNAFNYSPHLNFLSLPWSYIWQLGDEKYAVLATQGPTLCFDPPSNFVRDEITEKVTPFLESKIIYSSTFSYICTDARVKRS